MVQQMLVHRFRSLGCGRTIAAGRSSNRNPTCYLSPCQHFSPWTVCSLDGILPRDRLADEMPGPVTGGEWMKKWLLAVVTCLVLVAAPTASARILSEDMQIFSANGLIAGVV